MIFDIFFSISQTPVANHLPSEKQMFKNFFDQVVAADELGYATAWIAESHLSSEVQKSHPRAVIPHWQGEVGLNNDIFQLAHHIFAKTKKIDVGSAVMNLLCNGGPIAAAERAATFCTLHGLTPKEFRRLHLGFAAGRFDFSSRATGIVPRTPLEEACWPIIKGKVFAEATEIFLRLFRGETLSSNDISPSTLSAADFKSPDDWQNALTITGRAPDSKEIPLERRWKFDTLKIIPQDFNRSFIQPVLGSHDPKLQESANALYPTHVFNLSITKPEIIEDTHRRLKTKFHKDGGLWKRSYMPRTVLVFIYELKGLSPVERSQKARQESDKALSAYWTALEGTLDPSKTKDAADNALVGSAEEIIAQVKERFHPEDRLMLWFDFFNHDSQRVIQNMRDFKNLVAPHFEGTT